MTRASNEPRRRAPGAEETPAAVRPAAVRARMTVVGVTLGLAVLAAAGRVAHLQTVDRDVLAREARRNYVRTLSLDDWRGDIVDRNGELLAATVHRWAITADPQLVESPARTAAELSKLTGLDATAIAARLEPFPATERPIEADDPFSRLAREAVEPAAELVAGVFRFPVSRFDRPLQLLEHFHRLDQLRIPGLYKIVRIMSDAADFAARAINADAHRLRFFPARGRRFAFVTRDVDDETAQRVKRAREELERRCREARGEGVGCLNPLAAVQLTPEPRRYYPGRDLGTQLVGLVGADSTPLGGIEGAMDGVLAGGHHRVRTIRDRHGRSIFLEGIPEDASLAANGIELTIDARIQARAEQELSQAAQATGARSGYALVQRVSTGEILAAASFPAMNPNAYRAFYRDRQPLADRRLALEQARSDLAWAQTWPLTDRAWPGQGQRVGGEARAALSQEVSDFVEYEHAYPNGRRHTGFQDVYEPGSIMKVFTIAAWIQEAVQPLDHVYDLEEGHWELGDADDNVIHDDKALEEGDAALIMKKSSNVGAAKMGVDLGPETLERYLRDFGFGRVTGSGFPGEARGLLRPSPEWKLVELCNIAFGQGMAATGIQLVTALSALANDGQLMRPLLVRRVLDADGREVERWEPTVRRRVVSADTARRTLDLMRAVVEPGGTGTRAYIPEHPVAGKTGTGQKPHLRKRGYSDNMWVGTFFGVAPADDPELAVLVLLDEPKGKRYGGVVAAPAFRRIMRWTLQYLGSPSPFDAGRQLAWLDPDELRRRRAADPERDEVMVDVAPPVSREIAGDVPVPDFTGLTMARARQVAHDVGLGLHLLGSGVAHGQDWPPHERVPAWTEITVTFAPRRPRSGHLAVPPHAPATSQAAMLPPGGMP